MFNGYLKFDGQEIVNAARTKAYLAKFRPEIKAGAGFREGTLRAELGHGAYEGPLQDEAPWYDLHMFGSEDFYGLVPLDAEGGENSSRTTGTQDLMGDGVLITRSRFGALEMRWKVLAIAASEHALNLGLGWLRDRLSRGDCGNSCGGHDAVVFRSTPRAGDDGSGVRLLRRVEVQENVTEIRRVHFSRTEAAEIEFTLVAGLPWLWTPFIGTGSISLDSGYTAFSDPANEDCSEQNGAYRDFINDPFYTEIAKPPRPPVIKPKNIIKPASWRRKVMDLLSSDTHRWGRVAPKVTIETMGAPAKMVRLRFYNTAHHPDLSGCGYAGEFLVSYVPANSVMVLDAQMRTALVYQNQGAADPVPGGHLLYGSDGRPFTWPTLGCKDNYKLAVDYDPTNTGLTVRLDLAIRE